MATEYLNNKTFERLISGFQEVKKERDRCEMIMEDIRGAIARTAKRGRFKMPDRWRDAEQNAQARLGEFHAVQGDLANAFYTLSENLVRYANFHLIDPDDAIQEGVVICFEKIDRFDPRKGKAFNYMTTCILNHFRQLYRTAKNYNELKRRYLGFLDHAAAQNALVFRYNGVYKKHSNAKY